MLKIKHQIFSWHKSAWLHQRKQRITQHTKSSSEASTLLQCAPIKTHGNTERIGNVCLLQWAFDLLCFNLPALDSNIHLLKFNKEKGVQNKQPSKANHKQVQKEPVCPLTIFAKACLRWYSHDSYSEWPQISILRMKCAGHISVLLFHDVCRPSKKLIKASGRFMLFC